MVLHKWSRFSPKFEKAPPQFLSVIKKFLKPVVSDNGVVTIVIFLDRELILSSISNSKLKTEGSNA